MEGARLALEPEQTVEPLLPCVFLRGFGFYTPVGVEEWSQVLPYVGHSQRPRLTERGEVDLGPAREDRGN